MHPLLGPRERVKRANRQIVTLRRSFGEFFKDNLYEIDVAEFTRLTGDYSLRVKSGPQEFPDHWPLVIGEIAHNLRAALDGLVCQLAILDNPGSDWRICERKRTSFPIRLRGTRSQRPSRFTRNSLLYLQPGHVKRIELFQPYKRGNGGRHSPLFLLQEMNNTDKHRLLTVLVVSPARMTFSGLSGGTSFKWGVPLKPNAKVGSVKDVPPQTEGGGGVYVLNLATGKLEHGEMEVNVTVSPGVRFGDSCQAAERLPVIPTLRRMADEVSRIIESFSDDFS